MIFLSMGLVVLLGALLLWIIGQNRRESDDDYRRRMMDLDALDDED
jgi:hypothetical protein